VTEVKLNWILQEITKSDDISQLIQIHSAVESKVEDLPPDEENEVFEKGRLVTQEQMMGERQADTTYKYQQHKDWEGKVSPPISLGLGLTPAQELRHQTQTEISRLSQALREKEELLSLLNNNPETERILTLVLSNLRNQY